MAHTPTVVLSVLLAAGASTGVSFALRPTSEAAPDVGAAALQQELGELRRTVAELQKQTEALAKVPAAAAAPVADRVAVPTISDEQIAAAIAAWLQRNPAAALPASARGTAEAPFDFDRTFAELQTTSFWADAGPWKRAYASGRMDELVAKFEALAKASPNDPKAQMQLANAYLAYLQMDQTKAPQLSLKADRAFDAVLDLDETHWEARFSKAVSYTFWPDFLGKKKDAIKHFETLVEQQETQPAADHQAQTYLYLGNLLEQRDPAKAKEIWARGARRHPNNQELAKKAGG
jgi:tetratricopeptide (TPR) repeat protein